ncbi:MAG: putative porin [Bacteroidales bacterium]
MRKTLLALAIFFCHLLPVIAQIDTNVVVYSWKLDESMANRIRVVVDTALDNFQKYNPAFSYYSGIESLGNISLPTQSLVFTERDYNQEFTLVNNFYPFMFRFNNTHYVNTRKPFTNLFYFNGGSNQTKEEMLDVLHTQNLTKTLNFGIRYRTLGSLGQYNFQKVKNNAIGIFSSLSNKNYSYHLSVYYNHIIADENGGIANDSLVTDTTIARTKDIPTLFSGIDNAPRHYPDVSNDIKNLNILSVQEVSFRSSGKGTDTTATTRKLRIFYPKLIYILSIDRTSRLFIDKDPAVGVDNGLYPTEPYFSNRITNDSMVYWKLSNSARLQFQGRRNNHYFIDYSYEMLNYSMSVKPDSVVSDSIEKLWFITEYYRPQGLSYNSRMYNSYLSSGFTRLFANRIEMNLYGRYFVSGYRSGDFFLSADMKVILGKLSMPLTFLAKIENELKTPDYLYTHYFSNNYVWVSNFKKTSRNHLSTNLAISSKKFDIQGDYYLLSNVIYMNEKATPAIYRNALSVFSLGLTKQFDFWKITSRNKLIYQRSENRNVLDLPEIAFSNSTYLKHLFNFRSTGGKLLAMLGFDMFYNTKYYASAYMPSLASFHRQSNKRIGNYPYFDVFLNLQLKRFKFFAKMEHVNSGWIEPNYFSVLHYPRNRRDLKFGLSWTFYD